MSACTCRLAGMVVCPGESCANKKPNELIALIESIGRSQFEEPIEYEWHSTPHQWAAYRHGYDGAEDSRCKIGFGKTKEAAAADLIEQENG